MIATLLAGCGTTRIYRIPYNTAQDRLIKRLGINTNELIKYNQTQIHMDSTLKKYMPMEIFTVILTTNIPDRSMTLTAQCIYDIGAIGGEYTVFQISKINETKTRIKVDYSDRAVGCFIIPFAFDNPGWMRERRIADYIFEEEK